MEPKANFKNILEAVRHDIRNNMPAGTLLPTETELAARYNVSRPTIAKVYNTLQKEGYVLKKQGIGTTVIYQGINHKTTFGLLLPGLSVPELSRILEKCGSNSGLTLPKQARYQLRNTPI